MDEKGIERAFERDGVFEKGDFDGDPWSVSVYSWDSMEAEASM